MLEYIPRSSKKYNRNWSASQRAKVKYNLKITVKDDDYNSSLRFCNSCQKAKQINNFQIPNKNRKGLHYRRICNTCLADKNKKWKKQKTKYRFYNKIKIMKLIQTEIKCVRCGCDDIKFLEINHKDGGGGKEYRNRYYQFYQDVMSGKRKTEDLELLCRPCNHIHYLEMKYGKVGLKVIWES